MPVPPRAPQSAPLTPNIPAWPGVHPQDAPILSNNTPLILVMNNNDISTMILDRCSARSLVLLLRTNRQVNTIVTAYIKKTYDIYRFLCRYFTDPLSFRYLQAYTGTVISGSTALQFFDRGFYPESDFDIYVPKAWGSEVGHFLLRAGYVFAPRKSQHPTFDSEMRTKRVVNATATYGNFRGIAGVFDFEKVAPDGTKLKIQLMFAVRSPMEVILRYHSSMSISCRIVNTVSSNTTAAVMNVITFEKAYCLFPRATLDERFSLVCTTREDEVMEAIYRKYTARGWNFIRSIDDVPDLTSDPALRVNRCRWISDRFTWVMNLPLPPRFRESLGPLNGRTKALGRDPVSVTSWGQSISDDGRICEMMFYQPQAVNLFYEYVFSGRGVMIREPVNTLLELTSAYNAGCHSNALYSRH